MNEFSFSSLRLARYSLRCAVLGPGVRGIVWVQGCSRNCPDCTAPEMRDSARGFDISVSELADRFLEQPELEGLTFSGGEPMNQAGPLADLVDRVREKKDFSFFCYTGYQFEDLREAGTVEQKRLLTKLDVLVDGPYIESRHSDRLWRGSDNQKVWFLSNRYAEYKSSLDDPGQGLEFEFDDRGVLQWTGIPPLGFRKQYRETLRKWGIGIISEWEGESQPGESQPGE